jgi:hypothetical protein
MWIAATDPAAYVIGNPDFLHRKRYHIKTVTGPGLGPMFTFVIVSCSKTTGYLQLIPFVSAIFIARYHLISESGTFKKKISISIKPSIIEQREITDPASGFHSDYAHYLEYPRADSSRSYRISGGTCRTPGGSCGLHDAGFFHRRRRYFHRCTLVEREGRIHSCWFQVLLVLALCHNVYGFPHHNYSYEHN